jgi:hypothetical protein
MICTRSGLPALLIALVCAPIAAAPVRAAYVVSTCQACTSSVAGDCETAPSVYGAGQTASMSRAWDSPGFHYATDTNMTLDYVSFAAFARASGFENPENGGVTFGGNVARIARSIGHVDDVLTAGEGGAAGFFRIPLHLTGGVAISWQNGGGNATLVFDCVSSAPGSPYAIGHCPIAQYDFTADQSFDTVVDFDVPIVLGQPFEYRITASLQAMTGHGYGDLIPFEGATEATFGSDPFAGASVLDANHVAIPGAPISASESGFVYAPEASSAASAAVAIAAMRALRRRV